MLSRVAQNSHTPAELPEEPEQISDLRGIPAHQHIQQQVAGWFILTSLGVLVLLVLRGRHARRKQSKMRPYRADVRYGELFQLQGEV